MRGQLEDIFATYVVLILMAVGLGFFMSFMGWVVRKMGDYDPV